MDNAMFDLLRARKMTQLHKIIKHAAFESQGTRQQGAMGFSAEAAGRTSISVHHGETSVWIQ